MTEETAPLGVELAHAGLVLLVTEVRDFWRAGGIGVCDGGVGLTLRCVEVSLVESRGC